MLDRLQKGFTMDGMQFVVALLDKVAWPVVVLLCFFALRKPLSGLIPQASRLRYKDFELEFGKELKAAAENAVGAFPELKQDKKALLIASADHMPSSAILEAWLAVCEAAELLIKSRKVEVEFDGANRYKQMEGVLVAENLIDSGKARLFSELRQLRNKVAHAPNFDVGKAEAIQYIELCFKMVDYLNLLSSKTER